MFPGKPARIEHAKSRHTFIITDCPQTDRTGEYKDLLLSMNTSHLIRLCEPTYPAADLHPITVHDEFAIPDGSTPGREIVDAYLTLLDSIPDGTVVAIHCVSGIGRAPLFAAIPLIVGGLEPLDTIEFVRRERRGAFNKLQVAWLLNDDGKGLSRKRAAHSSQRKWGLSSLFGKKR